MVCERLIMTLTSWRGDKAKRMRDRVLTFFKGHPKARFFLCIHTHADEVTGQLCNAHDPSGTLALYNTIEEVCDYFLGAEMISALQARSSLRGLLLLACGSSMGASHIKSVNSLVDWYVLILHGLC